MAMKVFGAPLVYTGGMIIKPLFITSTRINVDETDTNQHLLDGSKSKIG
jgi:hypothetical protein